MKRMIPPTSFKTTLAPGTAAAGELRHVAPADLRVLPNLNLRVEGTDDFETGLKELGASITENGFYPDKPLAGYVTADDQVVVIDGHRRLAAVNRLNDASLDGPVVDTLPVIIRSETDSMMDLTIAMIQSGSGVPLTDLERGIGFKRLLADGMTKDDIAKRVGISIKTVENALLVASAPKKALDLYLDGKVKYTHVMKAMRKPAEAVTTLQAMVKTAGTKGRAVARPSDAPPAADPTPETMAEGFPDQVTTTFADVPAVVDDNIIMVQILKDADMGAMLKQIAAAVRERVPHDKGTDDLAHVNGTITVTVMLEPTFAPTRKRRKPPTAAIVEAGEPVTVVDASTDDL